MAILKLPHWVLVNKFPAFHDLESATVLEQTSRLYGKINELIESYNGYCAEINKEISEYEAANDKDYNCFVNTVLKLTSDYIGMVDLKITQHDRKFDEYYKDFTENINKTIGKMLAELKESGELDQMVLESLDNMQTKFNDLEAKCNAEIEELEQTAKDLAADYKETKTALNTNYSKTKDALYSDYSETKAALDADYSETKADYQQNVTPLISRKELVLYDGKGFDHNTDFSTTIIKPIDIQLFSVVKVYCNKIGVTSELDESAVLCSVSVGDNGNVAINGINVSFITTDSSYTYRAVLKTVKFELEPDYFNVPQIKSCDSAFLCIQTSESTISSQTLTIRKIVGVY